MVALGTSPFYCAKSALYSLFPCQVQAILFRCETGPAFLPANDTGSGEGGGLNCFSGLGEFSGADIFFISAAIKLICCHRAWDEKSFFLLNHFLS
jgi:hypothetical protein